MKRAITILLGLFAASAVRAQLPVTLTIQEPLPPGVSGIARTLDPVSSGIPLPKGAIACGSSNPATCTGLSGLTLTGASMQQFRCLAVWLDNSCKWVLVSTEATVSAGGTNTGFSLVSGAGGNSGGFGSNMAADSNAGNPNAGTITVTTGAATFVIKKANQNAIDSAVVGATTLIATGTSTGYVIVGPASPATACPCSTTYTSANDATSTAVIEENGPVRVVVKETGLFNDGAAHTYMRYTARLIFYYNTSRVQADFHLQNADQPTSTFNQAFKGYNQLEVRLSTPMTGTTFTFGNSTGTATTGSFSGTQDAYLWQGRTTHWQGSRSTNSSPPSVPTNGQTGYEIHQGAGILTSNTATSAAANMFGDFANSSGAGIEAGIWLGAEQFPSSIQMQSSGAEVRIGLRPDETLYTSGGAAYTYGLAWLEHHPFTFFLNFHSVALASPQNAFLSQQYDLQARASVAHYNFTGAWPTKMVTGAEMDAYYSSIGICCNPAIPNATPEVTQFWSWPDTGGVNMQDLGYVMQQQWLERGYGGNWTWAKLWQRFLQRRVYMWSDGFNFRTGGFGVSGQGYSTASSSNTGIDFRNWLDGSSEGEHAHAWDAPDWYYLTGDEMDHDFILDGPLDRWGNTSGSMRENNGSLWNEREIGNAIISTARLNLFACSTNAAADCAGTKTVLQTVLNAQALNDITSPVANATSGNGISKTRGIHYGCCGWDNFGGTANGPGGAGTARQNKAWMSTVFEQGMMEAADAVGPTWTNASGGNYYRQVRDYAYGLSHWGLTEAYHYDGVCSPVSNCGMMYEVFLDYPQSQNAQSGQETVWYGYGIEVPYRGNMASFAKPRFDAQLRNVNSANSNNGSWDENGNYMVSHAMYYMLHPGTTTQVLITPSVVNNGGGSYTLSWSAPGGGGVTKYTVKHNPAKTIVDDLVWDITTNTSTFNQATNQPFWSSNATRQQPTVAQTSLTVTTDDLTGAALASAGESFLIQAMVDSTIGAWQSISLTGSPLPDGTDWTHWVYDYTNKQLVGTQPDAARSDTIYANGIWALAPSGAANSTTYKYTRVQQSANFASPCPADTATTWMHRHTYSQFTFDPTRTRAYMTAGACNGDAPIDFMGVNTGNGTQDSGSVIFFSSGGGPHRTGKEGAIEYMANVDRVLIHGGFAPVSGSATDWTYEWNPNTNTYTANACNGSCAPGVRASYLMAYSYGTGKVMITGGRRSFGGASIAITYLYDPITKTWAAANPAQEMPATEFPCGGYDKQRDRVVVYLSTNQLWQYSFPNNLWSQIVPSTGGPPMPTPGAPDGNADSVCGYDYDHDWFIYTAHSFGGPRPTFGVWFGNPPQGGGGGGTPAVSLAPSSLNFVNQLQTTTSVAQNVTLTNTGTATLTISGISISGDFAQSNNCGASLPAAGNCSISVTFTPSVLGAAVGTLTVTDNAAGSPHTVALSGNGTATVFGIGNVTIQGNVTIKP